MAGLLVFWKTFSVLHHFTFPRSLAVHSPCEDLLVWLLSLTARPTSSAFLTQH